MAEPYNYGGVDFPDPEEDYNNPKKPSDFTGPVKPPGWGQPPAPVVPEPVYGPPSPEPESGGYGEPPGAWSETPYDEGGSGGSQAPAPPERPEYLGVAGRPFATAATPQQYTGGYGEPAGAYAEVAGPPTPPPIVRPEYQGVAGRPFFDWLAEQEQEQQYTGGVVPPPEVPYAVAGISPALGLAAQTVPPYISQFLNALPTTPEQQANARALEARRNAPPMSVNEFLFGRDQSAQGVPPTPGQQQFVGPALPPAPIPPGNVPISGPINQNIPTTLMGNPQVAGPTQPVAGATPMAMTEAQRRTEYPVLGGVTAGELWEAAPKKGLLGMLSLAGVPQQLLTDPVMARWWEATHTPEFATKVLQPLRDEQGALRREEIEIKQARQNAGGAPWTEDQYTPRLNAISDRLREIDNRIWSVTFRGDTGEGASMKEFAADPLTALKKNFDYSLRVGKQMTQYVGVDAERNRLERYYKEATPLLLFAWGALADPLNVVDVGLSNLGDMARVAKAGGRVADPARGIVNGVEKLLSIEDVAAQEAQQAKQLYTLAGKGWVLAPTPQMIASRAEKNAIDVTQNLMTVFDDVAKNTPNGPDALTLFARAVANPDDPEIVRLTGGYTQSLDAKRGLLVARQAIGEVDPKTVAHHAERIAKGETALADLESKAQVAAQKVAELESALPPAVAGTTPKIPKNLATARAEVERLNNAIATSRASLDTARAAAPKTGDIGMDAFRKAIADAGPNDAGHFTATAELASRYDDAILELYGKPTTTTGKRGDVTTYSFGKPNAAQRFLQAVNNVQSIGFMGLNFPAFGIRNGAGNLTPMIADGGNPFRSLKHRQALWDAWGTMPAMTSEGIAAGNDAWALAKQIGYFDKPSRWRDVFGGLNQRGFLHTGQVFSQNIERGFSQRIVEEAIGKYWNQVWTKTVRELKNDLIAQGVPPDAAEYIAGRSRGAMNQKQLRANIEDAIRKLSASGGPPPGGAAGVIAPNAPPPTTGLSQASLNTVLDEATHEAAHMAGDAPLADHLAEIAAKAQQPEVLIPALQQVNATASDSLASSVVRIERLAEFDASDADSLTAFFRELDAIGDDYRAWDRQLVEAAHQASRTMTPTDADLLWQRVDDARSMNRRVFYNTLDHLEETKLPDLGFDQAAILKSRRYRDDTDKLLDQVEQAKHRFYAAVRRKESYEGRNILYNEWRDLGDRIFGANGEHAALRDARIAQRDAEISRALVEMKRRGPGAPAAAAPAPTKSGTPPQVAKEVRIQPREEPYPDSRAGNFARAVRERMEYAFGDIGDFESIERADKALRHTFNGVIYDEDISLTRVEEEELFKQIRDDIFGKEPPAEPPAAVPVEPQPKPSAPSAGAVAEPAAPVAEAPVVRPPVPEMPVAESAVPLEPVSRMASSPTNREVATFSAQGDAEKWARDQAEANRIGLFKVQQDDFDKSKWHVVYEPQDWKKTTSASAPTVAPSAPAAITPTAITDNELRTLARDAKLSSTKGDVPLINEARKYVNPDIPADVKTLERANLTDAERQMLADRLRERAGAGKTPVEPVAPPVATPVKEVPTAYGTPTSAFSPDYSRKYDMRYKVVSLDDLVTSHTDAFEENARYIADLQPRLRDRAASQTQIDRIAKELQPDGYLQPVESLDRGAPIVGGDNLVESGNGRTMALRKARQDVPANWQAYQARLQEVASQYGISPEELAKIKDPVLVRERITEVDRPAFVREANESSVLGMGTFETSLQDAGRISDDLLSTLQVEDGQTIQGALTSPANADLVKSFVGALSDNERAAVVDASGRLNSAGLERLKNALFAKTYPGDAGRRLLETFSESLDYGIKQIETGLYGSLAKIGRAESLIRAGERAAELSISDDVAAAIDVLARLRQEGIRVSDFLAQGTLFERELTPFQESLLGYFNEMGRSPKQIREFLNEYADAVTRAPNLAQGSLFGDFGGPTKEGIYESIRKSQAGTERLPLFGEAPPVAPKNKELAGGARGFDEVADEAPSPAAAASAGQGGLFGVVEEAPTAPPVAREPWQMTADEFAANQGKDVGNRYVQQQREAIVRKAVKDGKPVPAEVLADYPDLAPKASAAPVFTRDEIVVSAPSVSRRKRANGVDGESVTTITAPSSVSDESNWNRLSDIDKINAHVEARVNYATGKPPTKKEQLWTAYGGKRTQSDRPVLAQNVTYNEAIEAAKDYVDSANPITRNVAPKPKGVRVFIKDETGSVQLPDQPFSPAALYKITSDNANAAYEKLLQQLKGGPKQAQQITADQAKAIKQLVNDKYIPRMGREKAQVNVAATNQRNYTIGDYSQRRNIHNMLTLAFPYMFWHSFTYPNWARRLAEHPSYIAHYARYRALLQRTNEEYYRQITGDRNATMPPEWQGALRFPFAGTDAMLFPERTINPLTAMVEDFSTRQRREAPGGQTMEAISNIGPGLFQPITLAYALWLDANGYKDAARQWFSGSMAAPSRLTRSVTAYARDIIPGAEQVIPAGGWWPEQTVIKTINQLSKPFGDAGLLGVPKGGLFNDWVNTGTVWDERKYGRFLLNMLNEGKITPEQMSKAAYAQDEKGLWGEAAQRQAKAALPGTASSFLLGAGFKLRDINDIEIDRMNNEVGKIMKLRDDTSVSKEQYQQMWKDLEKKYPWRDVYMMAGMTNPIERLGAYSWGVLERVPPGKEGIALIASAGITEAMKDKFYSSKGKLTDWTPAEQAAWKKGIETLTETTDAFGPQRIKAQERAATLHKTVIATGQAAVKAAGYDPASIFDVQSGYFELEDDAEKKAYLQEHPELVIYWDAQKPAVAAISEDDRATYEAFYPPGKPNPYDQKNAAMAQVYGADFLKEFEQYSKEYSALPKDSPERKQYRANNAHKASVLERGWEFLNSPMATAAVTAFAGNDPRRIFSGQGTYAPGPGFTKPTSTEKAATTAATTTAATTATSATGKAISEPLASYSVEGAIKQFGEGIFSLDSQYSLMSSEQKKTAMAKDPDTWTQVLLFREFKYGVDPEFNKKYGWKPEFSAVEAVKQFGSDIFGVEARYSLLSDEERKAWRAANPEDWKRLSDFYNYKYAEKQQATQPYAPRAYSGGGGGGGGGRGGGAPIAPIVPPVVPPGPTPEELALQLLPEDYRKRVDDYTKNDPTFPSMAAALFGSDIMNLASTWMGMDATARADWKTKNPELYARLLRYLMWLMTYGKTKAPGDGAPPPSLLPPTVPKASIPRNAPVAPPTPPM